MDEDINELMQIGYSAWIDKQLATPRGTTHLAFFDTANRDGNDNEVANAFWSQALTGKDQLRLRMAYALSQIFVISLADGDVDNFDRGVVAYLDMLADHSFGKYRDLLEKVALNPLMGLYLTHLGNQKADATGRVPDENFARETMQLFTIGLVKLNEDGTVPPGTALETYTGDDVAGLAKVFTGWSWDCGSGTRDDKCFSTGSSASSNPDRALRPMIDYPKFHSPDAKKFVGKEIPAGTSAAESLKQALDHLFAHPNVGPFIGRQLIQRFTTSNPSPAYVAAVARAFNNNGSGVRGDMKAVLKAVLMHPEARLMTLTSGKVREPVLRMSAVARAFKYSSASGKYKIGLTDSPSEDLAQAPLHAPSVFNFYRPGYVATGSKSAGQGLVAPELQIVDETSVAGYVNFMRDSISRGINDDDVRSNFTDELSKATNAATLVDHVTTLLTYGAIGLTRKNEIVTAVEKISASTDSGKRNRVNAAVLLTVSSPEFLVLK